MVFQGQINDVAVVIQDVRVGTASVTDGVWTITFIEHAKQYAELLAELLATGHANAISVSSHHDPSFWKPTVIPE